MKRKLNLYYKNDYENNIKILVIINYNFNVELKS